VKDNVLIAEFIVTNFISFCRFAHLTNHQVQKDYSGLHGIEGTQWSLATFKDYLNT